MNNVASSAERSTELSSVLLMLSDVPLAFTEYAPVGGGSPISLFNTQGPVTSVGATVLAAISNTVYTRVASGMIAVHSMLFHCSSSKSERDNRLSIGFSGSVSSRISRAYATSVTVGTHTRKPLIKPVALKVYFCPD